MAAVGAPGTPTADFMRRGLPASAFAAPTSAVASPTRPCAQANLAVAAPRRTSNPPESHMLALKDVHAFYGKSHVLHGVHFEVKAGEIVALLGRNGSGRSTTVKAIMGLVEGA